MCVLLQFEGRSRRGRGLVVVLKQRGKVISRFSDSDQHVGFLSIVLASSSALFFILAQLSAV